MRVPTVLQMEAVECGAAALAMILEHFGRVVPLEELRVACGISRDGSKAKSIVEAARRYGLVPRAYKKDVDQLRDLPMPAILHWNFNHFVVLEGIGRCAVYVNDPAKGPRVVAPAELDRAFTGIVLIFDTGPGFVAGGRRPSLARLLGGRLSHSGAALPLILITGLLLVVPGLLSPTFSRIFVDDVLVKGLSTWTGPLLAAMLATGVLAGVLTALQYVYLLRLETKLALEGSSQFFWHVLRLPVAFFTQRYAGEIASRVGLNDRIAQLLSGELASTILSTVMVVFYAALMLWYDVRLTVVGVSGALINLAALKYSSRRRADLNRRALRDRGTLTGITTGGLQSIETMKSMGAESDFFARWSGQHALVLETDQELKVLNESLSVLPTLVVAVTTTAVLTLGGLRVMDGRLSIGMVVAFQALLLAFISPVGRLFDLGNALQDVKGRLDRVDDVLKAAVDPQAVDRPEDARWSSITRLSGHIELRDLTFGYSPLAPPLIDRLSLTIKAGSRVALVGGSGSGKTTIARLICGLYKPTSGQILFDGIPRDELPRRLLTHSFAAVDQDVFLFKGTVRQNLTMWDTTVPMADIIRAASDAGVHDSIVARPGGYHGAVDEAGRNFSGGQRQRLEIARALVGNPSVIVLDEATSALDPITEKAIDDNLRRRGITCLLIAHRLSTIRDCDEILVLERGRAVQRGTHQQLIGVPGPYARLIAAE